MHTGRTTRTFARLAAALLFGAAACRAEAPGAGADRPADAPGSRIEAPVPPAGVVDSIRPIAEEIRRFQAELGPEPERLEGLPSRDALVARFVEAVEAADTAALTSLPLDAAEFGYLYYPHTRFTAPPYELAPSLLWFQIQNEQSRGTTRLLRRFAGSPIGYLGYRCEAEPRQEGPNRVWDECVVLLRGEIEDTVALRLFGTVLERGGAYRLVSLANDL